MKDSYYRDLTKQALTVINRPRYIEGKLEWRRSACRASRPMSTVVLDDEIKMNVLTDINEYLKNESLQW
jgi:chaperone BCS1